MAVLDKKLQHDLIVFDFSSAFDRVPHQRLLRKLDHYGVRGSTLSRIMAFLTDRTQQVTVEGANQTVWKSSAEYRKGQFWDHYYY